MATIGKPIREPNALVAYIHVPKGTTVVKRDYGYAAWWTKLELVEGTYELRRDNRSYLTYMCWGKVPGTILDANFQSGFGGVGYGGSNKEHYIGKQENFSVFCYDYSLRDGEVILESGIRIIPL